MSKEMLTTDDLAEYLHVHKNQIYRLIKEGQIPATRITGKWLFPKRLVDQWLKESACRTVAPEREDLSNRVVIAGSNDLAMDVLIKSTHMRHPGLTVSISNIGSLAGLNALGRKTCHIAASHLLDVETGEYNTTFIKQQCPTVKGRIVNLTYREQGLLIKKGNPLGIRNLKDLAGKKARFINRQPGSGTRVLLDYRLKQSGIDSSEISGYSVEAFTHLEVALAVFKGSADAGMGIRAAAELLNLDFLPIAHERFDLVIPDQYLSSQAIGVLLEAIQSTDFKAKVKRLGGYGLQDSGKVMA